MSSMSPPSTASQDDKFHKPARPVHPGVQGSTMSRSRATGGNQLQFISMLTAMLALASLQGAAGGGFCESGGISSSNGHSSRVLCLPEPNIFALRGGNPTREDAKRFMDSYTPSIYAKMRDDAVRTSSYRAAIEALAPNRTVLDIGTGGLALLAVIAAQSGARHVYAIEANEEAYRHAVETVSQAGLSSCITLLCGDACDVELPDGAKADIIVHEVLGEIASIEGVCRVVRDAQRRHLSSFPSPHRTSIPARASSWVAPCTFPDGDYWAGIDPPVILPPGATTLKLWHFPKRSLLSEWQEMEHLDFEAEEGLPDVQERELKFEATSQGQLAGFAVYMTACLLGDEPEIRTWVRDDEDDKEVCRGNWAQQVVLFGDDSEAEAGSWEVQKCDTIWLKVITDTRPMQPCYTFEASLSHRGEEVRRPLRAIVLDMPNFG